MARVRSSAMPGWNRNENVQPRHTVQAAYQAYIEIYLNYRASGISTHIPTYYNGRIKDYTFPFPLTMDLSRQPIKNGTVSST